MSWNSRIPAFGRVALCAAMCGGLCLPSGAAGLLIDDAELSKLPTHGLAWEAMLAVANEPTGPATVSDGASDVNVQVLAKALVYRRTGIESYRVDVSNSIAVLIGTEGGRTLDLGRELAAYVIAADLVDLPLPIDRPFRAWLSGVRYQELEGRTLVGTHEERPNNWGLHAGASRIAIAAYLGDTVDLDRAAQVFRGWLGDRRAYASFNWNDDLSWHADPQNPVGINPTATTIDGHPVGGVLPDDQRRGGSFSWPPPKENYAYEGLQGALLQALLLERQGYPAFSWEDRALFRAFRWLHEHAEFPVEGDDRWQPHVINRVYGSRYPAPVPSRPGKNFGWTDWLYGSERKLTMDIEPDGGLRLSWDRSCDLSTTDYEIYVGDLADPSSYTSLFCSTGGLTSVVLDDPGGSVFYLIVPRGNETEGSYGYLSPGEERPIGFSSCLPQQIGCD